MFKLHAFLGSAVAVVCVACGASFTANENGTASGAAGEAAGGSTSSAGSSSSGDAGEVDTGGTGTAGEASTAGSGGTDTGIGGSTVGRGGWGNGGWGSGGRWTNTGGGSTVADCDTLRQEYQAAVEKARVCDKGSTDQCSPSSVAQPVGGCGCPVLINAQSEAAAAAKKAYQDYQDNKCDLGGPVCGIACVPAATASCAQQAMGSGNTFVCTAGGIK
jgi:hypothetical protein